LSGAAVLGLLSVTLTGVGALVAGLLGRVKKRWVKTLAMITEHPEMTFVEGWSWSKHAARGTIDGVPVFVFGNHDGKNIELTVRARLDLPQDLVIGRQSMMSRLRRAGGPEIDIGSDALDKRFELRGAAANIAAFFNQRVRDAFERAWVVANDVALRDGNITVRRMGLDLKPDKVMELVGAVVEAAAELKRIGAMPRAQRLAESSRDPDPVVARMAAAALFEHEPDTPEAGVAYQRALAATDPWMRLAALAYPAGGLELLACAEALLRDGAAPNRCRADAAWYAVQHIKRQGIDVPESRATVAALQNLLTTANGTLLGAAVMTLEDLGTPPDSATLSLVLERANREARKLISPYLARLRHAVGPDGAGSLALTDAEPTDGQLAMAAESGSLEVTAESI